MTASTAVQPIVTAIRGLITVPTGMTLDTSGAAPPRYAPETIYVWPLRQTLDELETTGDGGGTSQAWFRIRVAWARAGRGEAMAQTRLAAISAELDAGVQEVVDKVRANRTSADPAWRALHVDEVTYDAVVTFDVRAAWIDISGWRFVT